MAVTTNTHKGSQKHKTVKDSLASTTKVFRKDKRDAMVERSKDSLLTSDHKRTVSTQALQDKTLISSIKRCERKGIAYKASLFYKTAFRQYNWEFLKHAIMLPDHVEKVIFPKEYGDVIATMLHSANQDYTLWTVNTSGKHLLTYGDIRLNKFTSDMMERMAALGANPDMFNLDKRNSWTAGAMKDFKKKTGLSYDKAKKILDLIQVYTAKSQMTVHGATFTPLVQEIKDGNIEMGEALDILDILVFGTGPSPEKHRRQRTLPFYMEEYNIRDKRFGAPARSKSSKQGVLEDEVSEESNTLIQEVETTNEPVSESVSEPVLSSTNKSDWDVWMSIAEKASTPEEKSEIINVIYQKFVTH